eukprot:TRINITY_DN9663_c0_g1_i6.p1 TRINITY_DN9663_c0_g1~~TRINITY_DN9663_c0_g1_i6.p1  ORF type:complete len:261 (-),score=38.67 TRINITY_DN9663_c0_g1_i6:88-870(-)
MSWFDGRNTYTSDGSHDSGDSESSITSQGPLHTSSQASSDSPNLFTTPDKPEVQGKEICSLCGKDHGSRVRPPAFLRSAVKRMVSLALRLPEGEERASALRTLLRKRGQGGVYACQLLSGQLEAHELALVTARSIDNSLPRPVGIFAATGQPERAGWKDWAEGRKEEACWAQGWKDGSWVEASDVCNTHGVELQAASTGATQERQEVKHHRAVARRGYSDANLKYFTKRISTYAKSKRVQEAFQVFAEMKQTGLNPNVQR